MSTHMRGLFHRRLDAPAQANADAEALAYTSLEEARLRVERLWPGLPRGSGRQTEPELRLCHRHLGLAGFHCCAEFGSGTRRGWLALAHDRLRGDERDPVRATLDAIVRATDAVEHALVATNLADNIQTAHGHVLASCESFGAYLRLQAWA
jgi:hypothetical protein